MDCFEIKKALITIDVEAELITMKEVPRTPTTILLKGAEGAISPTTGDGNDRRRVIASDSPKVFGCWEGRWKKKHKSMVVSGSPKRW